MASPYIDDAFITAFNSELHLNYEQGDSHFRGLCRTDGEVNGETLRFQKLGGLEMTTKSRYGEVPLSIPSHTHADATMKARYARVAIQKLDLSLLNTNVRQGYAQKMAGAANRRVDDEIVAAMDTGGTTNVINSGYSGGITRAIALEIRETFDTNDVPDDGMRFVAITPRQHSHLMTIDEFKHADNSGSDDLPYTTGGMHGRKFRRWLDMNWFTTNRLTGAATATVDCYAWHYSAVGHGIADDISADWGWSTTHQQWDGVTSLQMGSVVIDDEGIFQIQLNDTATIPS